MTRVCWAALALAFAAAHEPEDPRRRRKCREVLGALGHVSVRTVEDEIGDRTSAVERPRYACQMLAPYGRFVDQQDAAKPPVFWLEIPKCGSTTIKTWLHAPTTQNKRNRLFSIQKSFAVVREPLVRFLSGYGTIRARLRHAGARALAPFNDTSASERELFERFVELVTTEGDALCTSRPKDECVWFHVMSQMWFLEFHTAREIDYILRVESLQTDLDAMLAEVHLNVSETTLPKLNTHEGNFDLNSLVSQAPEAIKKILHHLRQDYACLEYPTPAPQRTKTLNK